MTARITSATRVSLKFIRGGLGLGSRSSQRSRCRLVSGSLPSVLLTRPVWRATCRTAQAITSLGPSIFSRPMGACESRQGCSKACIDRGAGSQTSTDLLPISSPLQAPVSSQGESLACHQHVAHHVEGRLLAQHADAARLNGCLPAPDTDQVSALGNHHVLCVQQLKRAQPRMVPDRPDDGISPSSRGQPHAIYDPRWDTA